ncbi:MAG: hypothetical protein AAF721_30355 [Myxococcota bacterium]
MDNPDFKDMLSALNDAGAEFIVVGAHALAAHGLVRATGELDLWVRADKGNAVRVAAAFEAFGGASLSVFDVTIEDLSVPGVGVAIGAEPNRIDLHTRILGVTFEEAWESAIEATMFGEAIRVLSHGGLVRAKRASMERRPEGSPKRAQDAADLAWLESLGPKKPTTR